MSKRQRVELAKFYLDISKLVLASFVLGLFTSDIITPPKVFVGIFGLTLSIGLLIIGLRMFE